jgi:hypothetical protein
VTLRDKLQKRVRELEAALSKALAKTQCRKPQQRYDKRARPIVGWFDCGECDTCLARKELAVAKGEKA